MKCPHCFKENSKVVDSRSADDNNSIRRRRECISCAKRFTTYERIEERPVFVIKKNGTRQFYSKEKLFDGITRSCVGREISMEKIEDIIKQVEKKIDISNAKEIESTEIGNEVMQILKEIDEVAYVRFASVYKNFGNIDTFIDELEKLKKEKEIIAER
ncbi:MAG: transcriptional regulator NrdR [Clostridiales bacterium]|nr:MAG: transcriptional regulator NrdR [Clostridiales bacterium]